MSLCIDTLRPCLEGTVPALIATCDTEGTPNITYVSQVHYVDRTHVALSFQFFNKTRQNVLANPQVTVFLHHPATAARYRLALLYRRTETEGPLFESMKARLAGIASLTGMGGVFRLLGADIYQVLDIERVPGIEAPMPESGCNYLASLRNITTRISACTDLAGVLEATLEGLEQQLCIHHAMILLLDAPRDMLYTVASRGYAQSGIGSEFPLGQGLIGVAGAQRTPILVTHMAWEYVYSQAVREHAAGKSPGDRAETAIPLPALPEAHSQLSVPILAAGRLIGVLHVESPEIRAFCYDHEDTLVGIASALGATMLALQQAAECHAEEARPAEAKPAAGIPLQVKHYGSNDSVFLGEDYLIKGVAGAIFWRLLALYTQEGRTEFTNRELRLDAALKLPDIDDNLEARLILLQRRLAERQQDIALEKTGRGRFRLVLKRPVQLQDMPAR